MLQMILRLETNPMFTQNFTDLESQQKYWISAFRRARSPLEEVSPAAYIPSRPYVPSTLPRTPTIHDFPSPEPIFKENLRGNLQTWSLDDELKVMATVLAYFHIAHKVRITILDAMFA